ncbi:MAG: hypothetical protein ACYSU6_01360 [Planctomycetota bacterium]
MAKKYTTNRKHFKIFKEEAEYWIKRLGITDWEISFEHQDFEDRVAGISWNYKQRWAVLYLSKDFGTIEPTDYEIRNSAYHEVKEVMLAPLRCISSWRYIQPDQIETEIHAVIKRMINCYFEEDYKRRFGNGK